MFQKIIVCISLVIMLGANALAVLLPLNGKTTKELSDAIEIFFVPEGYVFSIWSLIYIALIGYALYQFTAEANKNEKLQSIGTLFIVNALANAGWIFLWHYEYVATSVVLMLVILCTLIAIYQKLDIGRTKVPAKEYWLTHFPFSIYLGWISVATIANVAGALHVHEWGAWGIAPEVWSAIMIIVASVLAVVMLWQRKDMVFTGVVIWALIGIALKFQDVDAVYIPAVVSTTILVVAVLLTGKNRFVS